MNDNTEEALIAGLPMSKLPSTFRDAVLVLHQLGIQYLWIDSLCIKQDSREEWLREAPRMQQVYGSAAVNIVAAHVDNPESGLFHTRDPSSIESTICRAEWDDEPTKDYLIWNRKEFDNDYTSAPLTQRGWVFQERLLAPRILHFGKSQVYWRCSALFASESWPYGTSNFSPSSSVSRKDADMIMHGLSLDKLKKTPGGSTDATTQIYHTELWADLVAKYSSCKFTKNEDKLVAMSGVAKVFRQSLHEGDRYLAGLWRSELPKLLCWRRSVRRNESDIVATRTRPSEYRAPSWSWASIDGPISYSFLHRGANIGGRSKVLLMEHLAEIINAFTVPLDKDDTAQVSHGVLTIRGRLQPFRLLSAQGANIRFEIGGEVRFSPDSRFIVDALLNENEQLEGMELWALLARCYIVNAGFVDLSFLECIVLRRQDETQNYQRVGIFTTCYGEVDGYEPLHDHVFGVYADEIRTESEGGFIAWFQFAA
ncbi:unnamed protein product [Clonostachys rhizophaga]|uniref:Heterokaryon incompatibility domain-containing protein n=1 Tax=Clonostachys rhizophaga TaxID=160324 RepID=A0A9N9VIG7_9HYPO|nr:unnamed protein product [Clonostachys rhizophaga]